MTNSGGVAVICFFFQAEDGIRDRNVTGVQTCALPISCCRGSRRRRRSSSSATSSTPGTAPPVTARTGAGSPGRPSAREDRRRSEERRVGKECRSGWGADQSKKEQEKIYLRQYHFGS